MNEFDPIHVYVTHEEPVLAHGVVAILEGRLGTVARTCTNTEARRLLMREVFNPCDLIVVDHAAAMELLAGAGESDPRHRPRILILTGLDREWDVRSAIKAGVNGYLLQGCTPDQLIEAVEAVCHGQRYISSRLATRLAEGMFRDELTAREMEVLAAMSSGASNKRISLALGISNGTVKSHVRAIFHKVGACARTEAVALAAQRGLTEMRADGAPRLSHKPIGQALASRA